MHVQFKIHGSGKKNLHGDGFAIWYTKERLHPGKLESCDPVKENGRFRSGLKLSLTISIVHFMILNVMSSAVVYMCVCSPSVIHLQACSFFPAVDCVILSFRPSLWKPRPFCRPGYFCGYLP